MIEQDNIDVKWVLLKDNKYTREHIRGSMTLIIPQLTRGLVERAMTKSIKKL